MSSSDYNNLAIQNRKFAKTCVEKKRRDRINRCLDELKDLMSQADDKAKYQKMEKAEILEMAVSYMRNLRSQNANQDSAANLQSQQNKNDTQYYALAYRQCLSEFQNYLSIFPGLKDDFKSKIMGHMTQHYLESLSHLSNQQQNKKAFKRSSSSRYQPYQARANDLNIITSDNSFNSDSKFADSLTSLNENSCKLSNDSHNESSNSENLAMSPALSQSSLCSSPTQIETNKYNISSSSSSSSPINYYSNYEDFMKVWRPW